LLKMLTFISDEPLFCGLYENQQLLVEFSRVSMSCFRYLLNLEVFTIIAFFSASQLLTFIFVTISFLYSLIIFSTLFFNFQHFHNFV
jgi:hypothetical protein